jgi:hypothetical protein
MKVELKDLEKALTWIKSNTNAITVRMDIIDNKLFIKTTDKYEKQVEIQIHTSEVAMMPLITSTDRLR